MFQTDDPGSDILNAIYRYKSASVWYEHPFENTSPISFLHESSVIGGITSTVNTTPTSTSPFARGTVDISTSDRLYANSDMVGRCYTKLTKDVEGCLWEGGGTGNGAYLGLRGDTDQGTVFRLRAGDGGTAYTYAAGLVHTHNQMALIDIPYNDDISNNKKGFAKYDDDNIHEVVWEIRIGVDDVYPGRVRIWIDGELMGTATTSGTNKRLPGAWAGPDTGGFGNFSSSVCTGEPASEWPLYEHLSSMDYYRDRLVNISTDSIVLYHLNNFSDATSMTIT